MHSHLIFAGGVTHFSVSSQIAREELASLQQASSLPQPQSALLPLPENPIQTSSLPSQQGSSLYQPPPPPQYGSSGLAQSSPPTIPSASATAATTSSFPLTSAPTPASFPNPQVSFTGHVLYITLGFGKLDVVVWYRVDTCDETVFHAFINFVGQTFFSPECSNLHSSQQFPTIAISGSGHYEDIPDHKYESRVEQKVSLNSPSLHLLT